MIAALGKWQRAKDYAIKEDEAYWVRQAFMWFVKERQGLPLDHTAI
ncbi:MAG: hypothetical protein U0872_07090 [Planctomycetaceae bacterium]